MTEDQAIERIKDAMRRDTAIDVIVDEVRLEYLARASWNEMKAIAREDRLPTLGEVYHSTKDVLDALCPVETP